MGTTQHFRFILLVLVLVVGLLDLLGLVVVVEDRLGVLIRYSAPWNFINSAVTGAVLEQREFETCNQTSQPIAKC